MLRSDFGTENSVIAKIHIGFRLDHSDTLSGNRSYIYGPSTAKPVSVL